MPRNPTTNKIGRPIVRKGTTKLCGEPDMLARMKAVRRRRDVDALLDRVESAIDEIRKMLAELRTKTRGTNSKGE